MTIHLGRLLPDASCDTPERRRTTTPETRSFRPSFSILHPVGFTVPPLLPGARRTGPDGKIYEHQGVDLEAKPGIPVTAPADGTVEVHKIYRDGRYNNEYENVVVKTGDGTEYGMGYVTNKDENGKPVVKTGDRIKTGERIGTTQNRARQDKSSTMKNHVHFTKKVNGEFVNPTQDINSWE